MKLYHQVYSCILSDSAVQNYMEIGSYWLEAIMYMTTQTQNCKTGYSLGAGSEEITQSKFGNAKIQVNHPVSSSYPHRHFMKHEFCSLRMQQLKTCCSLIWKWTGSKEQEPSNNIQNTQEHAEIVSLHRKISAQWLTPGQTSHFLIIFRGIVWKSSVST